MEEIRKSGIPLCESLNYREAVAECSRKRRLLLVYVHNGVHPATDSFIAQTLLQPDVISLITENFLVWMTDVQTVEGFQFFTEIGGLCFPFVSVHCRCAGSDKILRVIEGEPSKEGFTSAIREVIADNATVVETLRLYSAESRQRQEIWRETAEGLAKTEE